MRSIHLDSFESTELIRNLHYFAKAIQEQVCCSVKMGQLNVEVTKSGACPLHFLFLKKDDFVILDYDEVKLFIEKSGDILADLCF